jgi:hypothetical protein
MVLLLMHAHGEKERATPVVLATNQSKGNLFETCVIPRGRKSCRPRCDYIPPAVGTYVYRWPGAEKDRNCNLLQEPCRAEKYMAFARTVLFFVSLVYTNPREF